MGLIFKRPACDFEKYMECVRLLTEAYKFLEVVDEQITYSCVPEVLFKNHARLKKLMDEMGDYIKWEN